MNDIVVGSVAVDIVPDVSRLRKELAAKVKGLAADVTMNADVSKVREQIKEATRTRPADIRVKLDDTEAKAQLVALQNSLKDKTLALSVSTTAARAKLAELQAEMASVKSGSLDLDDTAAQARIAEIQAQVKSLKGQLEIDTAPARAEIALMQAQIASTRVEIKADADTAEAEVQLASVARTRTATINTQVSKNGVRDLAQSAQNMSLLATAALTLGPALVPIVATIGALGAALVAPLALAGGGATVFAFLTGFAIKKTEDQKKQIDTLKKAVDSARASLRLTEASAARSAANSSATAQASANAALKSARQALASATTASQRQAARQRIAAAEASLNARQAGIAASQNASVAAAQDRVNDAVSKYQDALKSLTPAQKTFLEAQDKFKGAFDKLVQTTGAALLGPVTQAMNLLSGLLPKLKPIIKAFSDVFSGFLDDAADATKTKGFKDFVDLVAGLGARSFKQLTQIMGDLAHGAGNVFKALAPFGTKLLGGLRDLSRKFVEFTGSNGVQKGIRNFVKYIKDVGPQVGDTLGAIARAIGHIVTALAPLGPPALSAIKGIANAISGIPVPVLTGIIGAFGAIALAAKASKGINALSGLLGGGGGLKGGGRGGLLGIVSKANPVPVLVVNEGFGGGVGGGKTGGNFAAIPIIGTAIAAGFFSKNFADNERARNLQQFGTNDVVNVAIVKLDRKLLAQGQSRSDFQNVNVGPFTFSVPKQSASLKSSTDHVDGLQASLAKASRAIDLIGPHADIAFGQATRDVADFSKKLDAVHDKKLRVILDDLAAVQSLKALQALRLKDKTLTINVERELDRVVGPGGGQGHPTGPTSGSGSPAGMDLSPTPRGSSNGQSGPLVNIQHLEANNFQDILRQSQSRLISRGNGGVLI